MRIRSNLVRRAVAAALVAAGLAGITASAFAGEAEIRRAVESLYPGIKVTSVTPTSVNGIYEVVSGLDILYSDATGSTLFLGQMIDSAARVNVTEQRITQLSAIKFTDLPLDLAIKTVKGDGSRMLATFEDPNCGYCKQLHSGLKNLTNYTLYTFLMPVLGEDSKVKSQALWCAPNRSEAWNTWMTQGQMPTVSSKCDTPVAKVLDLAKRLRVQGTPAIFFADGSRNPGYMAADRLERKLSDAASVSHGGTAKQ